MKVKILVTGAYRKRINKNKIGAVELEKGDIYDFEDDNYAKYLVDEAKLAEYAGASKSTKPGAEVVFEQDLSSDKSVVEQEAESRTKRGK